MSTTMASQILLSLQLQRQPHNHHTSHITHHYLPIPNEFVLSIKLLTLLNQFIIANYCSIHCDVRQCNLYNTPIDFHWNSFFDGFSPESFCHWNLNHSIFCRQQYSCETIIFFYCLNFVAWWICFFFRWIIKYFARASFTNLNVKQNIGVEWLMTIKWITNSQTFFLLLNNELLNMNFFR